MAFVLCALGAAFAVRSAGAEQCPPNEPTWISGRTVVWEPNLNPPQIRGVGEVFVYAFEPGDSTPSTRYMAVSDAEGHFCIHDTFDGAWMVTAFEPFTFRPFVRELNCTASGCGVGEIRLDEHMFRISDDYVNFGSDWWGGPFAQSMVMPAGSVSLVKVTFRSGAGSTNAVNVYQGQDLSIAPVGSSSLSIPGNPGGGRGTAVFMPGAVPVTPLGTYTFVLEGGSAVWRLTGNPYPDGQMYTVSGQTLTAVADTDMCLTLGVDGPDGNLTSFLIPNNDGWVFGQTVVQAFVARSVEITHASLVSGTPSGMRRIQASVSETIDGAAIGPVKETQGLDQQGVAFGWFRGEVPVTSGQTYYLRFHFPEGGRAVYRRELDPLGGPPYPAGQLYADSNQENGALWGRIMGPSGSEPGPDGGIPVDASPDTDGTAGGDAAVGADGGGSAADGGGGEGGGGSGGCGCRVSGVSSAGFRVPWLLLILLVMVAGTFNHDRNRCGK